MPLGRAFKAHVKDTEMNEERDTTIQHGIDNDPNNDTQKGAVLGGLGGAVTGGIAGAAMGPVGSVIGAAVGGVVGAAGSGAAVNAVDRVDNDNTVTGLGDEPSYRSADPDTVYTNTDTDAVYPPPAYPAPPYPAQPYQPANTTQPNPQYDIDHVRRDGVQTGGYDADGTPDTRGISEKVADAVTGDRIDDKTGKPVAS
jgi:hypothetical protein